MRYLNKAEVGKFLTECKSREGAYYIWPDKSNNYSGKDLPGATYKGMYDCSGLVTSSLYSAFGIDWRATKNAQALAAECDLVDRSSLTAGDLIFYGAGPQHISHVMVYLGFGYVFGASGGDRRTLTPEDAKKMNAKVVKYSKIDYRPDFVSCGRLRIKNGSQ